MSDQSKTTVALLGGILGALAASAAIVIFMFAGGWDWLGDQENATAIEGFFAIVQGIFAFALILLTFFTVRANNQVARETELMAQETELMAQETKRMAEAAVQQQRGAIRPVIVLRLRTLEGSHYGSSIPKVPRFDIEIANVGVGPALDTDISHRSSLNYSMRCDEVLPFTLAPGEGIVVHFELDQDTPFKDATDPTRWPRTQEDTDLIKEKKAQEDAGKDRSKDPETQQQYGNVRREVWKRHIRYEKDLTTRVSEMYSAGRVTAAYRDLIGAEYTSHASVEIADRGEIDEFEDDDEDIEQGGFRATWPHVLLRTISVREEPKFED